MNDLFFFLYLFIKMDFMDKMGAWSVIVMFSTSPCSTCTLAQIEMARISGELQNFSNK